MRLPFTDTELIEGIRARDPKVLQAIYQHFFPLLRAWISRNQGSEEAARDIFQEAMVVMFEKINQPQFQLSHSFQAYLMGVGKNLWLMQLRKKATTVLDESLAGPDLAASIADDLQRRDRYQVYRHHFAKLGDSCQQILQWFFAGESLREIAARLDTTEKYAKKRKFLCQKSLIEAIEADPRFHELSQ